MQLMNKYHFKRNSSVITVESYNVINAAYQYLKECGVRSSVDKQSEIVATIRKMNSGERAWVMRVDFNQDPAQNVVFITATN